MIGFTNEVQPFPSTRLIGTFEFTRQDQGRGLPSLPMSFRSCGPWIPESQLRRQDQRHAVLLLQSIFEQGMRADVPRSLGHGDSPVCIANRADSGAGAGGCDRPFHSWGLVLFRTRHFAEFRLSVDEKVEHAHRPYPGRAMSGGCATGQGRRPAGPFHTETPGLGISTKPLRNRRIPIRSSNRHYRLIADSVALNHLIKRLFRLHDAISK
jgi:hypothetical protein